jgi:thioredoxin-like negative regulator of GroEL
MLLDLKTQMEFEAMWFHDVGKPVLPGMRADGVWIQYHTATWCGACKRLDLPAILKAAEAKDVHVWKIDVDVNEYTSGYCGVRSMPTFQICIPKKIVSTLQSSDTTTVIDWIQKYA